MNGEWILIEIARWVSSFILLGIGYFLGVRSSKIQALRDYVTGIVKDNYPSLFNEIRRNSGLLGNYLENPFVEFGFRKLKEIWQQGFSGFMKKHHKDLFQLVAHYRNEIRPKLRELRNLQLESRKRITLAWSTHLTSALPRKVSSAGERIAELLLNTINPHNALSDILNRREELVRKKLEGCYREQTAHIHQREAEKPYVIKGETEIIDFNELSKSLVKKAESEIADFLKRYEELKKQNDEDVNERLLPLLQKYISNPVS